MAQTALPPTPVADDRALPARRGRVVALSALAGFLLTVAWSAPFVDAVIGDNVAGTLLGHDPRAPIAGAFGGIVFAFVTGLAGSFTACNIAAFGALSQLVGSPRDRAVAVLSPLGWLVTGMAAVAAVYGAIVGLFGTRMPQYATASATGMSGRAVQSMLAFGVIGIAFVWLGLVALGTLRDPFAAHPRARMILIGALIGGFLVGRPFPLYRQLFRDAADSHNPLFGAAALVLQSSGNILIMVVLYLALVYGTRGRLQRWLTAKPGRIALVSAAGFIVAGVFTLLYWDLRILARIGYIWYPMAPWT
jgi:hypothetical protein